MAEQVAHAELGREPVAAEPAHGRYVVFTVVSLALLMASVDQTIVATALPSIQHDLRAQVNWSSWTITIYALGQVLVMPLAGKLGDQYGRKNFFSAAIIIFLVGSALAGFSHSMFELISFRAIQGMGAGGLITVSYTHLDVYKRQALLRRGQPGST